MKKSWLKVSPTWPNKTCWTKVFLRLQLFWFEKCRRVWGWRLGPSIISFTVIGIIDRVDFFPLLHSNCVDLYTVIASMICFFAIYNLIFELNYNQSLNLLTLLAILLIFSIYTPILQMNITELNFKLNFSQFLLNYPKKYSLSLLRIKKNLSTSLFENKKTAIMMQLRNQWLKHKYKKFYLFWFHWIYTESFTFVLILIFKEKTLKNSYLTFTNH